MKIVNTTQNTLLADRVVLANTLLSRLVGLLNRTTYSPGEGLILTQCRSIHMFFMRFAIDVVFLSKENNVVGMVKGIKPFGMSPVFWKASYAIELPVGTITRSKTALGDRIELIP